MLTLRPPVEFLWDKGNINKNYIKHKVSDWECEEAFFDVDKKIFKNKIHSIDEKRYLIIGKTKKRRMLFIVFTIRKKKIRVISARDVNKKEIKLYE